MDYLMISVVPLLFIAFLLYSIKTTLHFSNDSQGLVNKLSDLNHRYNTNFRMDRQIVSKIFFDTYQRKVYLNDVQNITAIKDFSIFKSWEIAKNPDGKSAYTLLIFTADVDLPPIEIEYNNYNDAKADLNKLNSLIDMLAH